MNNFWAFTICQVLSKYWIRHHMGEWNLNTWPFWHYSSYSLCKTILELRRAGNLTKKAAFESTWVWWPSGRNKRCIVCPRKWCSAWKEWKQEIPQHVDIWVGPYKGCRAGAEDEIGDLGSFCCWLLLFLLLKFYFTPQDKNALLQNFACLKG